MIVTHSTGPVIAAKQATSVISIVFANAGDPVGTGLVASLARPGGNITGLSIQGTDTVGKRLDLLREVTPGIHRLAIMANVSNPAALLEMVEVQMSARAIGLEAIALEVRRPDDITSAFEAIKSRWVSALYVAPDPLLFTNRVRINTLALASRLPTMHGVRDFVQAGGLMAYGANFPDLGGAPPTLLTKFCGEQSRAKSQSSSRPSLISSSISRPQGRSTSRFRSRSCCALTR